MQPMTSRIGYKKKAYADIATLPECLTWLGSDVLDEVGSSWARMIVDHQRITRTDLLLKSLDKVWPSLVRFDEITPFSVTRNMVNVGFLQSVERDKILDYSYPVLLGRPPDASGVEYYEKKLKNGYSQNRLIKDFITSIESRTQMNRIILDNKSLSEFRRSVMEMSSFVYFRRPKKGNPAFFGRASRRVAQNESAVDWYFLYKDEVKAKHLLSPGMNLIGAVQPDGRIRCGLDWIAYGPKIGLSSGSYTLTVRLEADKDFQYYIDTCVNGGLTHFFELNLSGSCDMIVNLEIKEDVSDFEFRILNTTDKTHLVDLHLVSLKKL